MQEPYAQYKSKVQRTVCTNENATELSSSLKNTFQNVAEMRNPYKYKNRRRRPEPTLASLLYTAYYISYLSKTVKAICW
jgi:hypothetical protein